MAKKAQEQSDKIYVMYNTRDRLGIFPTQGSNLHLLYCRRILYCLGSPVKMKTAINMSLKDMGL